MTFTDDHTRFTRLMLLKSKDEMLEVYKSFAVWAQTQHGVHLRLDRRGEYMGKAFTKFLKSQGTERRLTTHDTPQHNRVVESLNRRLVEHIHAILYRADLPKSLWGEAAHFIIWLKNRITTKPLGKVTPYQQLYGTKPNLSIVPEWGQRVWVHQSTGSKLDGRAAEGQWVGFDAESTHAHRIYWLDKGRISVERDIRFTSNIITVGTPPLPTDPPPKMSAQLAQPATQVPNVQGSPSAAKLPPPATSSGEEEIPDEEEEEEEEEVKDQLNTPGQLTIKIPPSVPKNKAPAQGTRRSA